MGGAPFNPYRAASFQGCISDCQLTDVDAVGPRFTWFRGSLRERLDRALGSAELVHQFPNLVIRHLHRIRSDHRPILACFDGHTPPPIGRRPFRFLAPWLGHDDFHRLLESAWHPQREIAQNLLHLTSRLRRWNKEVFSHIHRRKEALIRHLEELESQSNSLPTEENIQAESQARKDLGHTLWEEEVLWVQKARSDWIIDGDRNTRYFHTLTLRRRSINRILALRQDDGTWVEDPPSLGKMAVNYFQNLFCPKPVNSSPPMTLPNGFPRLPTSKITYISRSPTMDEVHQAIKSMGNLKAPGKDGYQPIFFKHNWHVVGTSVYQFVSRCFDQPDLVASVNETVIVLIPKRRHPELMQHFRPISLCNVVYKTITKCLATRLRPIMKTLVTSTQASFVPGRQISDNIIILQEVIHSMETDKGRKKRMVLKIDLMKAYDRVRWSFLHETLVAVGLEDKLIALIMSCVQSVKFQLLWNGGLTDHFIPSQGIRQGCPLSPFLFTLCMERLSHLITQAVNDDEWKAISLSPGGPPLSHLFYADDLILFGEASSRQVEVTLRCLSAFSAASGQAVSIEKSIVYFSQNVDRGLKASLARHLGFPITQDLGKYLGVPSIHGRLRRGIYQDVLDRMDRKLSGWKVKSLSLAGRVTLAQSILSAIPSFVMQTTVLPASICADIDRRIRNFVWGSSATEHKPHLISWERICTPKSQGGLGLRLARELNTAYMTKLAFTFMQQSELLWVRVLQSKYTRAEAGFSLRRKYSQSVIWRGIRRAWPIMITGSRSGIRDGTGTLFWTSLWVDAGIKLLDHATVGVELVNINETVADYVAGDGGWNLGKLRSVLPSEVIGHIVGMSPPRHDLGEDIWVWGGEHTGKFSIKSAYELIINVDVRETDDIWNPVWKWKGPNRVRHFLWLTAHGRLLTNAERHRRHMTAAANCPRCPAEPETLAHTFRDCSFAIEVWKHLDFPGRSEALWSLPFHEWLGCLLKSDKKLLFGVTLWSLWKTRNAEVFTNTTSTPLATSSRILAWLQIVSDAQSRTKSLIDGGETIVERDIGWKPGLAGWMTLNTDGSVRGRSSKASAGGLLRDAFGHCHAAFTQNLGSCSITRAEMRGLITGLEMAWELGCRKVAAFIDSQAALDLFLQQGDFLHTHQAEVLTFRELLSRDWEVVLEHTFREANQAADHLASIGDKFPFGRHAIPISDPTLGHFLLYDSLGLTAPRYILNKS
ncbi:Putative ribonuclease H protein At1g65750 [Linum grandiflorum]